MIAGDFEQGLEFEDVKRVRGVVLAGAYSWGDTAFDKLVPRPLLPVADWPLILYALGWLLEGGIRNAAVCINRATRGLPAHLIQHIPADLMDFVYHEDPMPRGPAGCVRDAASHGNADTFIVIDGTAIPSVDLRELLRHHRVSGAALTVASHREPSRAGRSGRQVPSGIYIIERQVLDHVKRVGYVDIKENLIPTLYDAGARVLTYSVTTPSLRVLDLATYLSANEWMIQRLSDQADPSTQSARGTFVAGDAVLVGPVWLGRDVRVLSGATIVGPTSIGDGSVVEKDALVSRSAIWARCVVGRGAFADRCLLADGATLEPGRHAVGTVKATQHRPLRDAGATRDSSSFAELLRRGLAAKAVTQSVAGSGITAVLS